MTERRATQLEPLHLFALAGFAVAQPVYDVLGRSPEFFWVRRSGLADVVLVAGLLSLAIPALLVALQRLALCAHATAGRVVQFVLVGALAALTASPPLSRLLDLPPLLATAVALVLGGASVLAYARFRAVRSFLALLSPSALLFPALFLFSIPVTATAPTPEIPVDLGAPPTRAASVVVVVFDEFGSRSLVDARGRIDSERYPHLARLTRDATWFRNATTTASRTLLALPTLLSGRYAGDRSRNLFTLLAGSHEFVVTETHVPHCPSALCGDPGRKDADERIPSLVTDVFVLWLLLVTPPPLDAWLPDLSYPFLLASREAELEQRVFRFISARHAQQAYVLDPAYRARVFDEFIDSIERHSHPTLYYLHMLLPHEPSVYLPSGAVCPVERHGNPFRWGTDQAAVAYAHQRHLLQVAFADRMVGKLVARLRETGLYDESLIVLTADHGVSHRPRGLRRSLSDENLCDILPVPLIIKAPHQARGETSDRNVELIDVLPTIADLLGIELPWSLDGASAFDAELPERETKQVNGPSARQERSFFGDAQLRLLPADLASRCLENVLSSTLYGFGPDRDLLGRDVSEFEIAEPAEGRVELDGEGLLREVDPASGFIPCQVSGRLIPPDDQPAPMNVTVVVAVDDTIRSVTRTSTLPRHAGRFAMSLPEQSLRPGPNRLAIYLISGDGGSRRLHPVRSAAALR